MSVTSTLCTCSALIGETMEAPSDQTDIPDSPCPRCMPPIVGCELLWYAASFFLGSIAWLVCSTLLISGRLCLMGSSRRGAVGYVKWHWGVRQRQFYLSHLVSKAER